MGERVQYVNPPRSWLLYICYIFVRLTTISMFVSSTFLVSRMILQMLFLVFSFKDSEEYHQEPIYIQMSSLPGLSKPSSPPPAVQTSWCRPVNSAHVPSRPECLSKAVSYKTLKVYLAAIRLMHIENGLLDPTTDDTLHLVCRGTHRQQINPDCTRLPITINLLRTLKTQLRSSEMSLLEQRLLWAAFTLSFYGFLRASECLSLTWSDMLIFNNYITITIRQSKTDPFRRGQSMPPLQQHTQYEPCTTTMTWLQHSNHMTWCSLEAPWNPYHVHN